MHKHTNSKIGDGSGEPQLCEAETNFCVQFPQEIRYSENRSHFMRD